MPGEAELIALADIETWRRVEQAIHAEAKRLCSLSCRDDRCPCGAGSDADWRRDALQSLRARATNNPENDHG